jgi:hypothetical protein
MFLLPNAQRREKTETPYIQKWISWKVHTGSRRVKHFIEQLGCGFVLHDPGQLLLTSAEKMVERERAQHVVAPVNLGASIKPPYPSDLL